MTPRYLDVQSASSYLSRTPMALYLLVHRRAIPFIKQGKRLMFDRLALDRWMAEGTINGELPTKGGRVVCEGADQGPGRLALD